MRDYTEPVALFDGAMGIDAVKSSWATGAPGMYFNRWVDCRGFDKLRISAVGDADKNFEVQVFFSNAVAPAPDVLPDRYYYPTFYAETNPVPGAPKHVHQDVLLGGAQAVGIRLINGPVAQDKVQLRAFLLR